MRVEAYPMQYPAPHPGRRSVRGGRIAAVAALAAAVLLGATARPASAQEDSTAAVAAEPQPPIDRWAATAALTLTSASGNQDFTVLTTGFTLRHLQTDRFGFRADVQARYYSPGDAGAGQTTETFQSYKGSFNLDLSPFGRWSPFLYASAENDASRRLDARINGGIGAKYQLYDAAQQGNLGLSVAVLHSYEALDVEAVEATNLQRWDVKLVGQKELREGVTLSHDTQYQPTFDRLRDYLLTTETAVKVMVNSHFALSVSHEYSRDVTPAPGVGRDDSLLTAGILVEL